MSKRAIEASSEFWTHIMTEGWTTREIECTKGLPDDARFVGAFLVHSWIWGPENREKPSATLAFVFESENWSTDAGEYKVTCPCGEEIPVMTCEFRQET